MMHAYKHVKFKQILFLGFNDRIIYDSADDNLFYYTIGKKHTSGEQLGFLLTASVFRHTAIMPCFTFIRLVLYLDLLFFC